MRAGGRMVALFAIGLWVVGVVWDRYRGIGGKGCRSKKEGSPRVRSRHAPDHPLPLLPPLLS